MQFIKFMKDEKLFSALKEINEKLKGLNWIILSGLAVKIYADFSRDVNDIDILIPNWNEFCEASKIFGKNFKKRFLEKENFTAKDSGFELNVKGVDVEVTAGMWKMKFEDLISQPKIDEEWIKHTQEKELFGLKLRLQPLEDLIVQKIAMNREKDKKDLEFLLTKLGELDLNFLRKDAKNWNCLEKVVSFLEINGKDSL
jgi:predicted nucleotidyltransferase